MVCAYRHRCRRHCAAAPHLLPTLYGLERTQTSPGGIARCRDVGAILATRLATASEEFARNPVHATGRAEVLSAFSRSRRSTSKEYANHRCGTRAPIGCNGVVRIIAPRPMA